MPTVGSFRSCTRVVFDTCGHAALFATAYAAAWLLRFDGLVSEPRAAAAFRLLPLALACKLVVFKVAHGPPSSWQYVSLADGLMLVGKAMLGTLCFGAALHLLHLGEALPPSMLILDAIVTVAVLGAVRISPRLVRELLLPWCGRHESVRLLVIGAGDLGEALLRQLRTCRRPRYRVVGFLDPDPAKHSASIHGVPVLGAPELLPRIAPALGATEVIVVSPFGGGAQMRRLAELARLAAVKLRVLPALEDLLQGRARLTQIRDVAIEDLLRRRPRHLDGALTAAFLRGKRVLVTGAGGSIGAELCRQVAYFTPSRLVLVERSENALFVIERALKRAWPRLEIVPLIADVGDRARMAAIFHSERPDAVFHAAAHKHVPLVELNPGEGVKNNVFGTVTCAELAHETGTGTFVLISTDKAVHPSSVMGATKRVAELFVQAMARRSRTRFLCVRFGNVLGSSGSVVPIFQEQIRAGGPVTVTDPDMQRYFMPIPEASQLVLQAAAIGTGGEVFILDMGQPVRILDLARDLIRLSGLRPEIDIPIVFTGMRPGEKIAEQLSLAEEHARATSQDGVLVGRVVEMNMSELEHHLLDLRRFAAGASSEAIIAKLGAIVPEYRRARRAPGAVVPLRLMTKSTVPPTSPQTEPGWMPAREQRA
jgi:FlaA1/EpsC-like NDP-sugar epimerase